MPEKAPKKMKLKAEPAADVLKTFIQEDRTEARIYRDRVQNICYILAVASFAISAFLLGKTPSMSATQLSHTTFTVDLGLLVIMVVLFWRNKVDLYYLRRAMKARQDLLNSLVEGETVNVNPFPGLEEQPEPDIKDDDLYWVVGLSAAVLLVKMYLVACTSMFVVAKGDNLGFGGWPR